MMPAGQTAHSARPPRPRSPQWVLPLAALTAVTATTSPASAQPLPAPLPLAQARGAETDPLLPSERTPERSSSREDLYMSSPTRAESGVATSFYKQYGRTISVLELRRGVRIGELAAVAPSAAARTGAAAGPGTSAAGGTGVVGPSLSAATASSRRAVATAPPAATERAGLGGVAGNGSRALIVAALLALIGFVAISLAAPTTARAAVPDGFVGVSTEDVYTGSEAYATTQLAAQRKAGITIARQDFRWNEVEPKNGEYDFSALDRFVGRAAKAGIRVLPLLKGEPDWATSRPANNASRSLFPPKDLATFARFSAVIAKRFGPDGDYWKQNPTIPPTPITSYQLWNEPNLKPYWGDRPNSTQYANLAKAAAGAIRSVDPDAYIVSAGIPDSRSGQKAGPFIQRLLKAGLAKQVDAIAIHPYAISAGGVLKSTRRMRKIVSRGKGGRQLDLWITELGWASGGPRSPQRTVTKKRQGPVIVAAYRSLAKARRSLKLRGVVYFAWRDSAIYQGGKDFWGLHTGLLDRQGRPKPALKAVTRAWPKLK